MESTPIAERTLQNLALSISNADPRLYTPPPNKTDFFKNPPKQKQPTQPSKKQTEKPFRGFFQVSHDEEPIPQSHTQSSFVEVQFCAALLQLFGQLSTRSVLIALQEGKKTGNFDFLVRCRNKRNQSCLILVEYDPVATHLHRSKRDADKTEKMMKMQSDDHDCFVVRSRVEFPKGRFNKFLELVEQRTKDSKRLAIVDCRESSVQRQAKFTHEAIEKLCDLPPAQAQTRDAIVIAGEVWDLMGAANPKGRFCEHPGCRTVPSYEFEDKPGKRFCVAHKKDGMVYKKLLKCRHPDCEKNATFNFSGHKGVLFCRAHKKDGMVPKYQRCKHPGCETSASFNFPTATGRRHCESHKERGMVLKQKKRIGKRPRRRQEETDDQRLCRMQGISRAQLDAEAQGPLLEGDVEDGQDL